MTRYQTVTVTQVRASDGTLHKDQAAAAAHDRFWSDQRQTEALIGAIEHGPFGPALHKFCGEDFEGEPWKKDRRLEEVADLIKGRWAQLKAVMESAQ